MPSVKPTSFHVSTTISTSAYPGLGYVSGLDKCTAHQKDLDSLRRLQTAKDQSEYLRYRSYLIYLVA